MAPPDRQRDPNHPAIQGLDPIFDEAPEIVTWIEWLLHPEQHNGPRINHYPTGDQESDRPANNGAGVQVPYSTAIPGVHIDQIFDGPFALTGQMIEWLEGVYDKLNEAWWNGDNENHQLNNGIMTMLGSWESELAKGAASNFAGAILDFYDDHNKIIFRLMKCYLAYGGVIHEARRNMDKVMRGLVDAFHHKQYAGGVPLQEVVLTALGAVATAALTIGTGGAGAGVAATAWATVFVEVTTEVAKATTQKTNVGGETWLDIVHSYYRAMADVLNDARAALEERVLKELRDVTEFMPKPPALPPQLRDMGANPLRAQPAPAPARETSAISRRLTQ